MHVNFELVMEHAALKKQILTGLVDQSCLKCLSDAVLGRLFGKMLVPQGSQIAGFREHLMCLKHSK